MAQKWPTEEDRTEAIRRALTGLADGSDALEVATSIADLHPKRNTFPGEVFMRLAADALDVAGASSDEPILYEGLLDKYLGECEFRRQQKRKIQYAILTSAAVHGGLEPDLFEEAAWWQADDYWRYALYAAVALVRAGADRRGISVAAYVEQLAEREGVVLS